MSMKNDSEILSSDEVLSSLPQDVQTRFKEAEEECLNAVTIHDFGLARGLLLGLLKDKRIVQVEYNSLFDRLARSVPRYVMETIPDQYRAQYSADVFVPASLSTRRARRADG
jgi:hypothetical protein